MPDDIYSDTLIRVVAWAAVGPQNLQVDAVTDLPLGGTIVLLSEDPNVVLTTDDVKLAEGPMRLRQTQSGVQAILNPTEAELKKLRGGERLPLVFLLGDTLSPMGEKKFPLHVGLARLD
ncbi:hypothetical protein KJ951_03540 [Patescibacteria group bacterium]|nr:hypothetical protein [Patescibacteria group bacterium]MBU1954170.1 hypothetical protein [Patescibacteria group bacterium]